MVSGYARGVDTIRQQTDGIFIPILRRWCRLIVAEINRQGVTTDGHAGFAEHGKDIICAGGSALALTLSDSLTVLTQDRDIAISAKRIQFF